MVTTACHRESFSQGLKAWGAGSPGVGTQGVVCKVKDLEGSLEPFRAVPLGGASLTASPWEELRHWTSLGSSPARHPLAVGQAHFSASLSLSFFICKMEKIKLVLCTVGSK